VELIRIPSTGNNNLDFHLAFHLGRLDANVDPSVTFHVLSRDTGFDGLLAHIKRRGRQCKRTAPAVPAAKIPSKKPSKALSTPAQGVLQKLRETNGRTRPRKEISLLNWLNSQAKTILDGVEAEAILLELKSAGKLLVQDSAVKYQL
jgi:hypothetical protein